MADCDYVVSLSCAVCTQFQSKSVGMRNYHVSVIDDMSNVRTSSFKEHASTDMQIPAMNLFKKQQSTNILKYTSIARAIMQLSVKK